MVLSYAQPRREDTFLGTVGEYYARLRSTLVITVLNIIDHGPIGSIRTEKARKGCTFI